MPGGGGAMSPSQGQREPLPLGDTQDHLEGAPEGWLSSQVEGACVSDHPLQMEQETHFTCIFTTHLFNSACLYFIYNPPKSWKI